MARDRNDRTNDHHLWFEPLGLLSRCSLNDDLLWVRVPIERPSPTFMHIVEKALESLQEWNVNACMPLLLPAGITPALLAGICWAMTARTAC